MRNLLKIFLLSVTAFISVNAISQPPQFSIATDLGVLRNFRKGQQFWSFGHTIQGQFHITGKDGIYGWLSYYANGKFSNDITATAKSPLTIPQQINYKNRALMAFKHLSIGWKRYLKGNYDAEEGWNLYTYAGFGVLFGRVENSQSVVPDTATYNVPVRNGKARFKRLTLDLGLGVEYPLGADVFLYTEGRAWVPTTDYPSKYVFVNNNAPMTGMFNVGVRILF